MIRKEEEQAENYIKAISKLEQRERNMLDKLKKTQTQHAAVAEDLDRINRNLDPVGPLLTLKNGSVSGKKSVSTLSKATPNRERPTPQVKAEPQPTPQSQTANNNAGSYYDRMYGEHKLYNVNDFYR